MTWNNMDIFATAFVEAALWADTPEDYEGNGLIIGLHSEELKRMRAFAIDFFVKNAGDCESYPEGIEQAGHDLWFTINGHGVGFWENKDEFSQRLDEACKALYPVASGNGLYAGDDGLLYWGD
jgi:hypothetical protein